MKKILAIDDVMDNLITIKALLEKFMPECEVLIAQSGQEGIDIAKKEQPDTILLDIIMPEMDGYEVCKKLKGDESTRHIPVIMLTAIRSDTESTVKGLEAGADVFFTKPIEPNELSAQIRVMFRIKEAEDKLRSEKEQLDETVEERTKELRESEERLRNIFENSTNLFYSHTPDHILTYLSPQVKDILGYTQEEAMVKWTEFASDNPINEIGFKHTVKAIETGKQQPTYELELVKKNGEKIWVEVREAPIVKDGKTISIVGALTDFTEHKRQDEALEESERNYRNLIEASHDGIYLLNNRKFEIVNERFKKMMKVTMADLNRPDFDFMSLIAPRSLSLVEDRIKKIARGEKLSPTYEFTGLTKDGKEIDIETSVSYVKYKDGVATLGIFRDITERKQAEEELKKLTNELEIKMSIRTKELEEKVKKLDKSQKAMLYMVEDLNETSKELKAAQEALIQKERLAVLGQFSGSISHELRNSLGVIDSSVYYLRMKLKDNDEKVQQHLKRIKSSVGNATEIIQSLLNLSRTKKPVKTKNDFVSIVSGIIESSKVPDKVKIIKKFPDQEISVNLEMAQVQIAFKNIITNAIEAIDSKGTLTVKIQRTKDGQAEISFKDTGSGIVSENLEKIFQPLFSTKANGIGFGLSISKMIIDNHGGSIKVESEPEKGANFIINLPLNT